MYYKKNPVSEHDVELMNEMRDVYLRYPFFGYRKLHIMLINKGHQHNIKKTERLAKLAGLKAVYSKKKTSIRDKSHKVYPYLLKGVDITHPNQVWQTDITYIKISGGFVYLVGLIDIFSRRIMGWNISPFLDTESCTQALNKALLNAKPEIINSDQGCQFTSQQWCNKLQDNNIRISMDGKGRWADNVYVERLWRSVKYELVYLYRFETVNELRIAIQSYVDFYNTIRPHQSLNYKTPDKVYREFLNVKEKECEGLILPVQWQINHSQIFR